MREVEEGILLKMASRVPFPAEEARGMRKSRRLVALLGLSVGSLAFPGILGWWLSRGPRGARPGPDILAELEIELVEAARGATRTIKINRHEPCDECGGSGWQWGTSPPKCDGCGGRGEVVRIRRFLPVAIACPTCAGEGSPITDPCPNCRGLGHTPHVGSLVVNVPPGVESGMWLQLRNQGEPGDIGAPRGNLRIRLVVKDHPTFDRLHRDLYCEVPVTDSTLTQGAEIPVPTLDGTCTLRIPRGTQDGEVLRVKGLGMPEIGGGGRGDILVRVVLEAPGS